MNDDPYELYKKNFGITPIVGCVNCRRLMEENELLKATLQPFARVSKFVTKIELKKIQAGSLQNYLIVASDNGVQVVLVAEDFRNAARALNGGDL